MRTRKKHSLIVILLTAAVLFVASTTISLAKNEVKKVVYQGGGKATIYFENNVKYSDDVKVIATDNADNTYSTKINSKGETKLQFQIKNYKTGKTYKITVKGLNSGNAVCSFKIYSKSKAVKLAKDKSKATSIKNVESKSDKYNGYAVWRVTYEGKVSGTNFKFTYLIKQQTGKVVASKREQA